ncbi:MAG: hypothetical protein LBU79_04715, partial [Planctomycetota bacterium]|nr:hypothetical protein [Planctomycetota bacterium]
MPRPRYRPGDTVIFGVKLHTGRQPSDLANYLGTRLGVVANQAKELLALEAVKLDGVITGKEARLDFSQPH